MKKTHRVTILGRELTVKSSASEEAVQAVELFINTRLRDIGAALQSSDPQLVLMLALLNTTEELLALRDAGSRSEQADSRIHTLLQQLETV